MKSLVLIFKNNFYRLLTKKAIIISMLLFVPLMILGGVYFTAKMETKASIAVVSDNKLNIKSKSVNVTYVKKVPSKYELVMNKYDAVLIPNNNRSFKVITIKSDKVKNSIIKYLKNPSAKFKSEDKEVRGVGTNIIGFLIMIVLMENMYLMVLYPEDRDFKTFKRMLVSPVSSGKYLLSQGIFNFVMVFIPVYLSVIIIKGILNINMGFSNLTLGGLLGLLILLGTAFSLFITSVIDDLDNASMLGNFIVMFSSILSGSFYSFADNNKILSAIVKFIPIKSYLTLVQGLENGKSLLAYENQLIYILMFTLALFILGTFITKKNLNTGKY